MYRKLFTIALAIGKLPIKPPMHHHMVTLHELIIMSNFVCFSE